VTTVAYPSRLLALPGVFRPRSDSWQLADAARRQPLPAGARVLELCAGPALAGLTAAREHGARLTTVDVSRRAALCAALNGRLNGVRVRALRGDLFAPVAGERFDLILANPPYLPGDEPPRSGAARAWEAGWDGRVLIDRICAQARSRLAPGGVLLLVHSEVCGAETTLRMLRARGLSAEIAARQRGPLGPLLRTRRSMLEARGLLRPGQATEDVLVLRAQAPRRAVTRDPAAPRRASSR
jgi:release factor glutamine methyltransferase